MEITNFYKNQEIFITGGLGFVGKALIEKLLRSCPDVGNIFILIRSKKTVTAQERLEKLIKSSIFKLIHDGEACVLNKLVPITGDVSVDRLGISNDDMDKIKNVSIVFHSAATVRFVETMRESTMTNIKGTFEIMKLCETLSKLKALIHVSTAYCNLDREILEEKIYPGLLDWRHILNLAEKGNDKELDEILESSRKFKHNSYTLSKHYAEQICKDFNNKLPIVVFRPAIVIPTTKEPFPGWIDNFNGPVGINVGIGMGVIKTILADLDVEAGFTPVDIAVKVMILAAYQRVFTKEIQPSNENETLVYNCSVMIKLSENVKYGLQVVESNPFEKSIFPPSVTATKSKIIYLALFFIFQLIPAAIIDMLLYVLRQKPFMLKIQKQIFTGNEVMASFMTTKWIFKSDRIFQLENLIPNSEKEKFSFAKDFELDISKYMTSAIKGAKKYLLKEPDQCRPVFYVKFKVQILLKYLFYGLLIYLVSNSVMHFHEI